MIRTKFWMIGEIKKLPQNKLPSIGDVLKGYYYYHLVLKNVKTESIASVSKEVVSTWKLNDIKTSEQKNVFRKLNQLVKSFELLKKGKTRRSRPQILKEKKWKKKLNDCFDITLQKSNNIKNGKRKFKKNRRAESENVSLTSRDEDFSSDGATIADDETDCDYSDDLSTYHKKQLNEKKNTGVLQKILNSPDVSSALDRVNMESGRFAIVSAAIGRVCGDNVSEEVFSLSTLKRRREKHRREIANDVVSEFDVKEKALVVHWDGKKLKDFTNPDKALVDDKVERLGIVVTGLNVSKIIGVERLENGTGRAASTMVHNKLQNAGVLGNIFGMCTDTTNSNTGKYIGACILFEKMLNVDLLYFACQHHVHEVLLGGVYEGLFGYTNAPHEALLLRLKNNWSKLEDKNAYNAFDDRIFKTNKQRRKLRLEVTEFTLKVLAAPKEEGYFPQDNYREILELSLLLMGHSMPDYVIKKPGACNKARFMAPAIYAMKIYLLREMMTLSPDEENNLKEFCLFVCLIYVKSWTLCQIPSKAPENTLLLYKSLYNYAPLNATISKLGLAKFGNHLWYAGHEMMFLSLFSSTVKPSDKKRIFNEMVSRDKRWSERNRKLNNVEGLQKKQLYHLVGPSSLSALKAIRIDFRFMYEFDAREWSELHQYKEAKRVVDAIKVVNDVAERSLKLMTDFNGKLTKKESGTQQLIQVVQDNRSRIPSTKKSVLSSYKRR